MEYSISRRVSYPFQLKNKFSANITVIHVSSHDGKTYFLQLLPLMFSLIDIFCVLLSRFIFG